MYQDIAHVYKITYKMVKLIIAVIVIHYIMKKPQLQQLVLLILKFAWNSKNIICSEKESILQNIIL